MPFPTKMSITSSISFNTTLSNIKLDKIWQCKFHFSYLIPRTGTYATYESNTNKTPISIRDKIWYFTKIDKRTASDYSTAYNRVYFCYIYFHILKKSLHNGRACMFLFNIKCLGVKTKLARYRIYLS